MTVAGSSGGSVRPAAPHDAAAIAAVHVATWRDAYAGLLPDDFLAGLDVAQWAGRWRGRLSEPPAGFSAFVFERGGEIGGFVSCGPDRHGNAGGEVYAIYVDPGCQGLGAGRLLMDAAVRYLAAAGYTEAGLWVLAGNRPSRGFYEAQGWRADGTQKPWTFDAARPSVPEVRYVRNLVPSGRKAAPRAPEAPGVVVRGGVCAGDRRGGSSGGAHCSGMVAGS